MLFVEFVFLPFFLAVFAVHWLLPSHTARKIWLLAASYVFYGTWDWRFLGLLLFSTVLDYSVGLGLERPGARRKLWLWTSLIGNLGLLGFFKYYNFFVDSAVDFLALLGFQAHRPTLQIILPVGISFYTFQTLSYGLDVYFRKLKATRSLLDFSLFVAFFPQLVAGPIVRASDFLPQLAQKKSFATIDVRHALVLFLIGFFKKACVSDTIAPFVDRYFAAPELYDTLSSYLALLGYAIQAYCDFSGYSDMAIACAWLFGYELGVNFAMPLLSRDLQELWRRWHISLTTWMRDYLYIPMGGNRGGRWKSYRNLMATTLLGGLWHGAAWGYVTWGGLHGLGLCLLRARDEFVPKLRMPERWPWLITPISVAATVWYFCLCLVPFRSQSYDGFWTTMKSFVLLDGAGSESLGARLLVLYAVLGAIHVLAKVSSRHVTALWRALPTWAFCLGLGVLSAVVLWMVPTNARPFIYFQF